MDEKMINAVKQWLEAIMPAVVETLANILPEDALREMGNEEGVHGPVSVDLEEFGAPITAIDFYVVVVEDTLLLATAAKIKDCDEKPKLAFDMFFTIADFATTIADDKHVSQLADTVLGQYKSLCG